uniref:Conserved secreted protein n=1 Tax=Parastrongyloides trichosuri TaxID=131310 RepID=A0A0N4ZAT5_PARTI
MSALLLALYINLAYLSTILFSCGSFDCRPYSNSVTLSYVVEPGPKLTYNRSDNRATDQKKTAAELETYLNSLGRKAARKALDRVPYSVRDRFTLLVELDSSASDLKQVGETIAVCPNTSVTVAAEKGTFFIKDDQYYKRTVDTPCIINRTNTNPPRTISVVGKDTGEIYTINLVFTATATIPTGQIVCRRHWNVILRDLKNVITTDAKSTVDNSELGRA